MQKIGILGAGQLAQMLALAGYNLDMRFNLYNFDGEATAGIGNIFEAKSGATIEEFMQDLDFITYEFENLPLEVVAKISRDAKLYPNAKSLETSQHRGVEKSFFQSLNLQVADFIVAKNKTQLQEFFVAKAEQKIDTIVKTCRFGYDGKGQKSLSAIEVYDFAQIWQELNGDKLGELLIEEKVSFDRELSLIAARNTSGEIAFYPLVENIHKDGILRYTLAPAPKVSPQMQSQAESAISKILQALDYVGIIALEMFEKNGELILNEMAPRVHNSGHWTQDSDISSQFENHLRAITNQPLGATQPKLKTLMLNLIGDIPATDKVLAHKNAKLHLYGKTARAGRKVGHINLVSTNYADLILEANQLIAELNLPATQFDI